MSARLASPLVPLSIGWREENGFGTQTPGGHCVRPGAIIGHPSGISFPRLKRRSEMIIDDLEIGVHELGLGDLVPPGGTDDAFFIVF